MRILKTLSAISITTLAMSVAVVSHAANFVEGKDYIKLDNPEKINANRIIVREFFWYGCPHCYHLDPHAKNWLKTKPKDVVFFHTPAALNPSWAIHAKAMYAAQELGVAKKAHVALFTAIHKDKKDLFNQNALADFYAQYGADKTKFSQAFNSFAVDTKIGRSRAAAARYKLSGVPAVVVHGKYVVKGSDAKVFQVVDYLVKKVRDEGVLK